MSLKDSCSVDLKNSEKFNLCLDFSKEEWELICSFADFEVCLSKTFSEPGELLLFKRNC